MIDQKLVQKVAKLCHIALNPEETQGLKNDLERTLDFVSTLMQVNTDGIEPMSHGAKDPILLRDDHVTDGGCVDKILSGAPQKGSHMFLVPRIVE